MIRSHFSVILLIPVLLLGMSCGALPKSFTGEETTNLYPIIQDRKVGYINRSGEIVIQPQFRVSFPFSEGLAVACLEQQKCGYIDETGKFQINPQFDQAYRFSDGLAAVVLENKVGYIDKSGKFVINPQFDSDGEMMGPGGAKNAFYTFNEGLGRVITGGKYGFIDKSGKYTINPQFDGAAPFFGGLAVVSLGGKSGYITPDGKIAINPQFEEALPFTNDLAPVRLNQEWGYINPEGKFEINPQFSFAGPFAGNGLATAVQGDKMGFLDRDGKWTVNPQFDWGAGPGGVGAFISLAFTVTNQIERVSFSEGLVGIRIGQKMGYADASGKVAINPQWNEAFPFYGGLAFVTTPEEAGWIDKEGTFVWRSKPVEPLAANKAQSAVNANANVAVANSVSTVTNAASNFNSQSSARRGRLTTDSNLRSEPNKDSVSLGIHFKGAKIEILGEASFPNDTGELSTWFRIRVYETGCSVNANLGCGKNDPNDADEGWVNAKNVLLD